jgi:hypothetical protein
VTTWRARIVLGSLLVLIAWGLLPSSKPPSRRLPPAGAGDAALHMTLINRLRAGEPYYAAVGDELRRGDYPAKSVFNWRAPLHYIAIAALSVPVATMLLKVLTLAAVLATAGVLARYGFLTVAAGTAAQLGALATAFQPDAVGVAEVWGGVLIALSLCAYYRQYWIPAALLGSAALFVRELAAPYCVVCAILAIRRSRRSETVVWLAAALSYAAYFGLHVFQVQAHQLAGDLVHTESWIRWNGIQFTLATVGVNGWLGFAGRWAIVLYTVLALAGAASTTIAAQARVALLTYLTLFAIAGLPFNYYWGFVTAPIWAFGFAHGADGIRQLTESARPASSQRGLR